MEQDPKKRRREIRERYKAAQVEQERERQERLQLERERARLRREEAQAVERRRREGQERTRQEQERKRQEEMAKATARVEAEMAGLREREREEARITPPLKAAMQSIPVALSLLGFLTVALGITCAIFRARFRYDCSTGEWFGLIVGLLTFICSVCFLAYRITKELPVKWGLVGVTIGLGLAGAVGLGMVEAPTVPWPGDSGYWQRMASDPSIHGNDPKVLSRASRALHGPSPESGPGPSPIIWELVKSGIAIFVFGVLAIWATFRWSSDGLSLLDSLKVSASPFATAAAVGTGLAMLFAIVVVFVGARAGLTWASFGALVGHGGPPVYVLGYLIGMLFAPFSAFSGARKQGCGFFLSVAVAIIWLMGAAAGQALAMGTGIVAFPHVAEAAGDGFGA